MLLSYFMNYLTFSARRRAPVRLAASTLAVLAAFPTLAQSTADNTLKEVIVTATRVAQPITDVVADVTLIDRTVIDNSGAVGLADLLGRVPGITMSRNGGPAATTSVYVRGAETRFTAVFVDGVRIDSQSTGGASWNALPLARIDRIEIVRGPAAAIYGSDAIGGVIQIFTRQGEAGVSRSIEVGMGSYGTKKFDMAISGAQGSADYSLGLTRETSIGFNAQPAANPDRDGYGSTAMSGRFGWQIDPVNRVEASFLSNDLNAQYDGYKPGVDDRALQKLQTVGLSWSAKWTPAYGTRVSVSQGDDRYETKPSVYVTDTTVTSYLLHNEYHVAAHTLTADLERREDKLNNANTTPVVSGRSQDGLALGYGYRLGPHTLQVNARHDQDSEFGDISTGSAAYAYSLSPNWRLTTSAGTSFRAPTLFQRFSIYGVSSLTPETARNKEIGIKYDARDESFGVVYYRNDVSNLITYVFGPGSCINGVGTYAGCYGNTALAQYEGVTLTAVKRVGAVALTGSLDIQNPHDVMTDKLLVRRAKKIANFGADTQWAGWTFGAELQLTGERFADAANTQRMAGYALINLHASTSLSRDWTLLTRVDNLGDQSYESIPGYATPGRTLYVGLKWAPV